MRIGIISEGHSDRAIISSIILKASALDSSDIRSLRPVYKLDATDLAGGNDRTISNWTHVKRECEEKELISAFLSIEGQDYVVIHLDSAETELYNVSRPDKESVEYCVNLRAAIIAQIQIWLGGEFLDKMLYAIAIEEIEAWLLSWHSDIKDTSKPIKAKEKLQFELGRRDLDSTINESNYKELARPFLKAKSKQIENILSTNCSLRLFFEEVLQKLPA